MTNRLNQNVTHIIEKKTANLYLEIFHLKNEKQIKNKKITVLSLQHANRNQKTKIHHRHAKAAKLKPGI